MPLTPGSKFHHYEIVALLGKGGMGEVYRAKDTKLDRDVAIKTMSATLAGDAQRIARFEREAKVLASLNHPNIAQIFAVEDGALIMELVEGKMLSGPVPLSVALDYASQIVSALEAAHEKGITHRDLKPANIMVTSSGTIKLLDFGLAAVTHALDAGADPAEAPTETVGPTNAGTILGTMAYMAPEQARGMQVDKRADIWAFGVVLYEMLAGRLFAGASAADIIAAVVNAEPDWSKLPSDTPQPILRLLRRCLIKDRKDRLPDITAARLELEEVKHPEPITTTTASRSARPAWIAALAAVLIAVALAVYAFGLRAPAAPQWSGTKLSAPANSETPRLSPDGQLLAFLTFVDELPQVGVMKPSGGTWSILTKDRDNGYVTSVSWAPDSGTIYFDRFWGVPRGVYSVPPLGGEPRLIVENAFNQEVLSDGTLIVAKLTPEGDNQLFHFFPDSGKLEPLAAYNMGDSGTLIRTIPGKKQFVYQGYGGPETRRQKERLWLFDFGTNRSTPLLTSGEFGNLVAPTPDGKSAIALSQKDDWVNLVSVDLGTGTIRTPLLSFARAFAPRFLDLAGDGSIYTSQLLRIRSALRITEAGTVLTTINAPDDKDVTWLANGDVAFESVSASKTQLLIQHPGAQLRPLLQKFEETTGLPTLLGDQAAIVTGAGQDAHISLVGFRDGRVSKRFTATVDGNGAIVSSPDHATLYYSSGGNIWAQSIAGGEPRKITQGTDATIDPSGQYLYVRRSESGTISLYRMKVDGSNEELLPLPAAFHHAFPSLHPSAVDKKGRILLSVIPSSSYYYSPAIYDSNTKKLTLPFKADGDVLSPGWLEDGSIGVGINRYQSSIWHYQPQR